ncbi:MAG: sigma-54-dependent Fis family transcriptional regulator [Gammaproteobacteria bacterium]|nr:sigma-54-dependent Fis family transcriptional regulator [Gammaproteobacteria bacterium]
MTATTSHSLNALVVEDDKTLNRLLVDQLRRLGFETRGVVSRATALEMLEEFEPSLIVLDIRLPDTEEVEFIGELCEICPIVVLTAYGSIDQAVKAVKAGASEYLIKPASPQSIELAVNRALITAALRRSAVFWQAQARPLKVPNMVGVSKQYNVLRQTIELVAPADTTVLIEGESGVGKELVAEAIHELSPRADAPFVAVDCCTLHENLFESELFGHERGAFTGADRRKDGLIEVAEKGTVFLDEIGEIIPTMQAKLLRVLETGIFRRLGGTKDFQANVRFVAATNSSLKGLVEEGKFRPDLFYRLSTFTIDVPPLRERRGDIEPIARHFLATRKFMRNFEKDFSVQALKALAGYAWPGNVRELRNVVERAVLLSGNLRTIQQGHISLPEDADRSGPKVELSFDHEPTLEELRENYLIQLLETHQGNRREVARVLGVSERNTYRLIKKLGRQKKVGATFLP